MRTRNQGVIVMWFAALGLGGIAWGNESAALTDVNALAAKAAEYAGKTVAVAGVVERVSESRRMFTLIDTSEATCSDRCQKKTVVIELGDTVSTLPKPADPVIATGTVDASQSPVRLTVTELVAGKDAEAQLKQAAHAPGAKACSGSQAVE